MWFLFQGIQKKREKKIDKTNKQTKKLNVWGFFISQNMHIKNIIKNKGFGSSIPQQTPDSWSFNTPCYGLGNHGGPI